MSKHFSMESMHFPVGFLFTGAFSFQFAVIKTVIPGLSPLSFILLKDLVRVLIFVTRKGHKWRFPLWNFFPNCLLFVDLMTMFFHRSKYTVCLPNQQRHKRVLTMFLEIAMECEGGLWQRKMKAVRSAGWSEL